MVEGLVGGEGFAIDASVIKADANRHRGVLRSEANWDRESPLTWPVREYLAELDTAEGQRKPPKRVSLTDPAAQWAAAPNDPAFYAYSSNYLIDTKAGVIVDVGAMPAYRTDEVNATRVMVARVEERFQIKPTQSSSRWVLDFKLICYSKSVGNSKEQQGVKSLGLGGRGNCPGSGQVIDERDDAGCATDAWMLAVVKMYVLVNPEPICPLSTGLRCRRRHTTDTWSVTRKGG